MGNKLLELIEEYLEAKIEYRETFGRECTEWTRDDKHSKVERIQEKFAEELRLFVLRNQSNSGYEMR